LQLGPWPGYTGIPIGGDRIPVRGLTGGEGKVGEKIQELTAVKGGGRCWGREGLWQHIDGEQGRATVLRGAATAFQWPEGRRVAGK
jgi:hypothetical protein